MALINLRNALMAGKRLPYDAEVEYLQSSGTQWIDTGYSFNSATDSIELTFELLSSTPRYKWIFGAYDTKRLAIGSGDATNMRRLAYNETSTYENDSFYFGGPHVFFANSTGVGIDGQKMIDFASFSTSSNILLYTIPLDTTAYCSNSRIWSYKHYRNGVLVRDLIPVRRGTVGYLYDRVSGKLFGNEGTGDFVLGQDVVPVEYIESHGTEWINSGVIGEPNIIVEAVYSWGANAFGADNCLVGSNNTSANNRFIPITTNSAKRVEIGAGSGWLFASPTILYDKNITYTARSEFISGSLKFTLDGTTVITDGRALTSTHLNMFIFASNENGGIWRLANAKLNMMKIIKDDAPVRSFRPVRVGTGSTWEGAMMDVLTRRIYRNAGSGAFAYGNDLKYPIPAE